MMVSVDELEGELSTKKTYEVPFPLLSDPEAEVLSAYRVVNQLDGPGVKRLEGFGIDIVRWSKRRHHKIAIPSIFLIDEGGVVRFAHAARDHRTRPSNEALLAKLKELRPQPEPPTP